MAPISHEYRPYFFSPLIVWHTPPHYHFRLFFLVIRVLFTLFCSHTNLFVCFMQILQGVLPFLFHIPPWKSVLFFIFVASLSGPSISLVNATESSKESHIILFFIKVLKNTCVCWSSSSGPPSKHQFKAKPGFIILIYSYVVFVNHDNVLTAHEIAILVKQKYSGFLQGHLKLKISCITTIATYWSIKYSNSIQFFI